MEVFFLSGTHWVTWVVFITSIILELYVENNITQQEHSTRNSFKIKPNSIVMISIASCSLCNALHCTKPSPSITMPLPFSICNTLTQTRRCGYRTGVQIGMGSFRRSCHACQCGQTYTSGGNGVMPKQLDNVLNMQARGFMSQASLVGPPNSYTRLACSLY